MSMEGRTPRRARAREARERRSGARDDGAELTALFEKLRPRRGVAHDRVEASQRARLCSALVQAIAKDGYREARVADLCRLAGVSTRAMYEQFPGGKEECLLASYELLARRAARRMLGAQQANRGARARLQAALRAYAEGVAAEPQAARLTLVDAFAAGPAVLARMEQGRALFEAMLGACFKDSRERTPPPPLLLKAIATGLNHVARTRVLAGRAQELPGLASELCEWALCYWHPAAELACVLHAPSGRSTRAAGRQAEPRRGLEAAGDERARLMQAAARLAAKHGCHSLRAARVAREAGLPRRCVREHFDSVEDCLLCAMQARGERELAHLASAVRATADWPTGVQLATMVLLQRAASDPVFARLGFLEVLLLGERGARLREQVLALATQVFEQSAPPERRPSHLVAEATAGAAWGTVHYMVLHDEVGRLPEIAGALSFIALAPVLGPQEAAERILAAHVGASGGTARPGGLAAAGAEEMGRGVRAPSAGAAGASRKMRGEEA
jgi:AcrR family transcriptional regulator